MTDFAILGGQKIFRVKFFYFFSLEKYYIFFHKFSFWIGLIVSLMNIFFGTPCISINLKLKAGFIYQNVAQNSEKWLAIRKNKITASKLGAYLGLEGVKEMSDSWESLLEGKDMSNKSNLPSFVRGRKFESKAANYFSKTNNASCITVGFVETVIDGVSFGCSPDRILPGTNILEIKTRIQGKSNPVQFLNGTQYCQCQMQLFLTNRMYCILMSYVPEDTHLNIKECAVYFFIKANSLWVEVTIKIISAIFGKNLIHWDYCENSFLRKLSHILNGNVPNFINLKILRMWTNKLAKDVKSIKL